MTHPEEEPDAPVWYIPGGMGAEAYYLEHYEEIERQYLHWCRRHFKDPQDVGSMTEYESQWG
jgi:hypothetical protein